MTAWGKITAKRDDGVCCNCDAPMGLGTTIYWLKGTRGYQCSVECNQARASKLGIALDASQGTKTGQTAASPSVDAPKTVPPANQAVLRPNIKCDTCGEVVPADEIRVYMHLDALFGDEEKQVCVFCRRMAKAQRNLKILGLWKPVKREDVVP